MNPRPARSAAALVAVAMLIVGCELVTPTPSPSGSPSPPVVSPSPTTPSATPQAGGLLVTAIATENGFSTPRWAPDGRAFAVTVGWGTPIAGSAEVFAADGRTRLATFPGGADVAWLDASTLAVFETDVDHLAGSVVVHSLSGSRDIVASAVSGGILGTGTGRLAILDPYDADRSTSPRFRVFGQAVGSRPGDPGWAAVDEIAGQPITWSDDGSLLATFLPAPMFETADGRTATTHSSPGVSRHMLGAGGAVHVRLVVRRYPGGGVVATPVGIFDARADWSFSPDGRFLAGAGTTYQTVIIDLASQRLIQLPMGHHGWTPSGELALVRDGERASLWHPDGSITSTDLPPGTPTFGPLAGEVFVTPWSGIGDATSAVVQVGGRSATIPLLPNAPFATASWAPDGSACYVTVAGDDAQQAHSTLYRVSAP